MVVKAVLLFNFPIADAFRPQHLKLMLLSTSNNYYFTAVRCFEHCKHTAVILINYKIIIV